MTSFDTGRTAEAKAAEYLSAIGYTIIEHNWHTRWCEIDIVAKKDQLIYFVEVKYRGSDHHGDGLDYITNAKLSQMRFAAEFWVTKHTWDSSYELAAIAVIGQNFIIQEFMIIT